MGVGEDGDSEKTSNALIASRDPLDDTMLRYATQCDTPPEPPTFPPSFLPPRSPRSDPSNEHRYIQKNENQGYTITP